MARSVDCQTHQMLHYRTRTLVVALFVAAMGSLVVRDYLDRQPLAYEDYSPEKLQQHLREGRCVLVTVYANWDTNTANSLRWLSHDVTRKIRSRNMVAMSADWTNMSGSVRKLMDQLDLESVPVLVIYSPKNRGAPLTIKDMPSETAVFNAIDLCCR